MGSGTPTRCPRSVRPVWKGREVCETGIPPATTPLTTSSNPSSAAIAIHALRGAPPITRVLRNCVTSPSGFADAIHEPCIASGTTAVPVSNQPRSTTQVQSAHARAIQKLDAVGRRSCTRSPPLAQAGPVAQRLARRLGARRVALEIGGVHHVLLHCFPSTGTLCSVLTYE